MYAKQLEQDPNLLTMQSCGAEALPVQDVSILTY